MNTMARNENLSDFYEPKSVADAREAARDAEWTRTQPPCGLDDAAEGNDAWLDAHTCPICGTLAPDCYDDEEHPSWDCSPCSGVRP